MNKKKVIIGVLMAAIFIMLAFIPAADNMHTAQSSTAIPQQGKAYQLNNQATPHFLLNHPNITINTVKLRDGFMILTFINGSLSSWVIYQNNIQAGRVNIMAFSDGNFSHYSHNVNENNTTGAVNTSNMTNHTKASIAATYSPGDAKYSIGWDGWAISFSHSELCEIVTALNAGNAVSSIIALITGFSGIGAAIAAIPTVASIIMGLGAIGLSDLAHKCGNGAWMGTNIFVHPEVGCNPVPYGY
ncbi:hypothetical protein [Ferroplasma acidarmanus]|uniref:Uncharacterized protein n=1 Tax=Ferroplasma acidarmanus Fer1 TaxID=333146 RepID=S0ANQ3_FERAC|nr:hypothetical protein [Ferroplasma acidarmanus]AGO60377.1 hypothetical protein FACI_IFERC00001G0397 [Ferroplasma acidarmanus Fer1]